MAYPGVKILCAGNRFISPDGAALWLLDEARSREWPAGVEWIEAGLGGLNLLPHFETESGVLLIDHMPGKPNAGLFSLSEVEPFPPSSYRHDSALSYLLHALPLLLRRPPRIRLMSCDPSRAGWMEQCLTVVGQEFGHV